MRRRWFTGPRSHRGKGNVTVELALAMPLLLFLVAGVLDLGMLFWEKHVITNAAREGARAAVKAVDTGTGSLVAQMTQGQVKAVVQNYVNHYALKNLDGSALVLDSSKFNYTWTTSPSGTVLEVALNQIPCQLLLIPNIKTMFGGTRTSGDDAFYLNAQTRMAAEWTTPPSP